MKKLILAVLLLHCVFSTYAEKIRVACIGNSITYGAGIANPEKNSYPAQLQQYLGEAYEVRNFGVSSSTLLSKGNYPYVSTDAYKMSLEFAPDIILIKLGTNDSKPGNITHKADFKADYQKLINSYRALASNPRIILMTPVRCFLSGSDIKDEVIQQELRPQIEQLAYEEKLEIINLYHIFGDRLDESMMPDHLHPSSIGAGVMAKHIYGYLSLPQAQTSNILRNASVSSTGNFNFYGFEGVDFDYKESACRLVKPYRAAPGNPWIIRARFWGHEPQTDIALLERGFHIAYCDVADLYGAPKAVKRWDDFYQLMTKAGLNPKVALEGMSRGGLIVYNWAAKNTDKVACIYADAPVMDFKSWPFALYSDNIESDTDALKLKLAYKFFSGQDVLKWKKNPVDHAKTLAKAKTPILHVVGDADDVVPVSENTAIFKARLEQAGGKMELISKPEVGHHPHSLNNPEPIVRFILKATGQYENLCARPVPGNEYRSAAGWTEGSEWHAVSEDITRTVQGKNLNVLLLGNSITQGFGGNRENVTYKPGKEAMDKAFGANNWESAGIAGDRTQNLLWRVRNGNYEAGNPANVVITIGVNNIVSGGDEPADVAQGIKAVAQECALKFPGSRIILFGLLPVGIDLKHEYRIKADEVHEYLSRENWDGIEYVNPASWFTNEDGSLIEALYSGDHLHLSQQGYQEWCEKIAQIINR